jgi:hypothetical protein
MASGPRETIYDATIAPLMAQIIDTCKANGIPFVASFELDGDEEAGSIFCNSAFVPDGSDHKLVRCYDIINERPVVFGVFTYRQKKGGEA